FRCGRAKVLRGNSARSGAREVPLVSVALPLTCVHGHTRMLLVSQTLLIRWTWLAILQPGYSQDGACIPAHPQHVQVHRVEKLVPTIPLRQASCAGAAPLALW